MEFLVALVFGTVAGLGLLAAKRPVIFANYFLADWQRERLIGKMDSLSWTGWILFGCGLFVTVVTLIAAIAHSI